MYSLLRSLRGVPSHLSLKPFVGLSTVSSTRFLSTSSILNTLRASPLDQSADIPSSPVLPRVTKKRENSRKTFLVDVYDHFWDTNEIVLICHRGNFTHAEQDKLVKSISPFGTLRVIKTSIFKYFLRASGHPDPASKEASVEVFKKKIRHPLEPALHGSNCVILIKDLDPKKVKSVLNLIKAQRERLFLVAAKVGNDIFDVEKTDKFKELPNLPELQMELSRTIQHLTVAGLIPTLSHNANMLHFSLGQYVDAETEPKSDEEAQVEQGESEKQ